MTFGEMNKSGPEDPDNIPGERQGETGIVISRDLHAELVRICVDALPHKAYGLVGGRDKYHPGSLYPCSTNLRNTPEWSAVFESFGDFHKNPDLGFVIDPSEVKSVMDSMAKRGESLVGVFHSHRFLCVEPSKADIDLSADPGLLCYIVSVTHPSFPEVGVYSLDGSGFRSIPILINA
jgi:proteasome lid subunit RPN8/RPN11